MFTGRSADAAEALERGLVNRAVPADQPLNIAQNVAKEQQGPTASNLNGQKLYLWWFKTRPGDCAGGVGKASGILMFIEDHKEA